MKKLIPLLCAIFLFTGCNEISKFYYTPEEAYQKGFKDAYEVKQEIDCIELDDDYVFWLAVIDTPDSPAIIEALTQVKRERYHIVNSEHYTPLTDAATYSLKDGDIEWKFQQVDKHCVLAWIWANPETVSGAMREKYNCKDYLIKDGDQEYSATLVYHFMELN